MEYESSLSFLEDVEEWVEGMIREGRLHDPRSAREWCAQFRKNEEFMEKVAQWNGEGWWPERMWEDLCRMILHYVYLGFEVSPSIHARMILGRPNWFVQEYMKISSGGAVGGGYGDRRGFV